MVFKQCFLEREVLPRDGHKPALRYTKMIGLPYKYCKVGEVLKLKNDKGEWIDGWVVKEVHQVVLDIITEEQIQRYHREKTGDSLP